VKRVKEKWPEAKTFGAAARYIDEVVQQDERQKRRVAADHVAEAREQSEREGEARRRKERATLKILWESLPEQERQAIREAVLAKQPKSLQKFPATLENFCLDEFARRRATSSERPAIS
jgi:hypothetical protein